MNDMRAVIVPKSDQINSDDLISGPITITIEKVLIAPGTEQPVSIHFEGDNGKPYKPCKSMARVMVQCWGPDASIYVGRSLTIYRDPKVIWGGMAVGGIRISHMSHIAGSQTMALTATKTSRKPFTVQPLVASKPQVTVHETDLVDKIKTGADLLIKRFEEAETLNALQVLTSDKAVIKQRDWLRANRPELAELVDDACAKAVERFTSANDEDDDFPGVVTP